MKKEEKIWKKRKCEVYFMPKIKREKGKLAKLIKEKRSTKLKLKSFTIKLAGWCELLKILKMLSHLAY